MKEKAINTVNSSTTPQMELDGVSVQHVMSMEQLAETSLNVAFLQQRHLHFQQVSPQLLLQVSMNNL